MFGIDRCFLPIAGIRSEGAKFTFLTDVLFPGIEKKTEQWGAGFKQSSGDLGQWKEL